MELLKKNDIFAQATFIIGERKDSHESIEKLRQFVNKADPDLAIFMTLTPFPGTETYDLAKRNRWIEDNNWTNYDMVHAVMSTENLSREEVQEELYECYRSFYGSMKRRIKGDKRIENTEAMINRNTIEINMPFNAALFLIFILIY